jgi:hypothetical protein
MTAEGRNNAALIMRQKTQSPDVLISRNLPDFSSIVSENEDPKLVLKEAYLNLPTTGQFESVRMGERGDELGLTVVGNALVDPEKPFDENGQISLNVTPEKAMEILSSNPKLAQVVENIRKQKYPNEPTDIGISKALRDGFSEVAPVTQKTEVRKSARDIEMQNAAQARQDATQARQNRSLDLQIAKEEKSNKTAEEVAQQQKELDSRADRFVEAARTGDMGFLGEYENQKSNIRGVRWVNPRQNLISAAPGLKEVKSQKDWEALTRGKRISIIENLELGSPGYFTDTASNSDFYKKITELINATPNQVTGLQYQQKGGMVDGVQQYETLQIPFSEEGGMERAFRAMENLRKSGQKFKIETKGINQNVPEGKDLTSIFDN